ncbi:beta-N-acetylhexosaminidase [Amorphus orientalis]|uniref:beta-N-acetylhexosaminidase n=1 Tax=Amorphus orientalis TaxID=649198 RepID=A0AAE3VN37_9HYPH|nr:beta-N-acetylhexosaminidase [Amorphus orientalis]MDQ0315579.1 beta-N-acetylhexosaminidase [Amorphus orientalis]
MSESRAFITGLAGPRLGENEAAFLRAAEPWGLILFRRNCESADQIHALVDESRSVLGWEAPVLIDQEGGRVQRLSPPGWPAYPPGRVFGDLGRRDMEAGLEACRLATRLIASDLAALGVDVDCLPVLDVPVAGAHDVIGDRAYGEDPETVAAYGRAAMDGLLAGGVLPVMKHIPGHGRAGADSHLALPVVDTDPETLAATDFAPFAALTDCPFAMTAHVVYTALDPDRPATTSSTVIQEIIRGQIGYDGCLMSDDLSMQALSGSLAGRAEAAIAAGCDLNLHCNGRLSEMDAVADRTPVLAGQALERCGRALALRRTPDDFDVADARRHLVSLLAPVWSAPEPAS